MIGRGKVIVTSIRRSISIVIDIGDKDRYREKRRDGIRRVIEI